MKHTAFHSLTEASLRAAAKVQGDRCIESVSDTTRRQPTKARLSAPKQTKPGQTQEKKGAREERTCPYCKEMPVPHRFSQCPMKASNQAKQVEEQVKKDVQIAKLSITSGKIEDITEGEEH
ncbi:hypothetical protein SARC_03006 [Sphaeroforma arctica JP610]|uniref:Uncharacterized protein n=1 Tax=Sphaeroforma arctica JP610 TaxID=667725 RepID=A0A0L0G969_9EUKA|nr:hypothetical protein SARC_03006 [Sphaeroforma arctica JP610]KNC84798.1 hypothetical protein SARC_03006 [Sphaeroforma arctica JP610]|eukprot:XP_014158700.1 hypothetical protein SARC_03006 [Sphaeroforma arctica JP610]